MTNDKRCNCQSDINDLIVVKRVVSVVDWFTISFPKNKTFDAIRSNLSGVIYTNTNYFTRKHWHHIRNKRGTQCFSFKRCTQCTFNCMKWKVEKQYKQQTEQRATTTPEPENNCRWKMIIKYNEWGDEWWIIDWCGMYLVETIRCCVAHGNTIDQNWIHCACVSTFI